MPFSLGFSVAGGFANSAAAPGPVELFPDPTLVDVADPADWSFSDPTFQPTGGTGPGLSLVSDGLSSAIAFFVNDSPLAVEIIANTQNNTNYILTLTIANFVSGPVGDMNFLLRNGEAYAVPTGNGDLVIPITTAEGDASGGAFSIGSSEGSTFDITAISLVEA